MVTLQPTKRRRQINSNPMQSILVEQLNIVCDVLEIAQLLILKLLRVALGRRFEVIFGYAVIIGF
jgi:hypothetical protein